MPFDKKRLKTKSYVKLFNHNKLIVQTLSMKFNVQEKNVFFIAARVSAECPLINYNKSLIKMLNMFRCPSSCRSTTPKPSSFPSKLSPSWSSCSSLSVAVSLPITGAQELGNGDGGATT